jgi:hypothetical protein
MKPVYRMSLLSLIPKPAIPLARILYYKTLGANARLRASLKPTPASNNVAPIFIIGCGRSGTSILGEALATHPRVRYFYEPYELWAAINPVTDFLQLYSRDEHHCILDAHSASSAARIRFQRLMSPAPGFTMVEKSPINAFRIGFLEALAPGARFLHIVRDGVHVAYSIERIAATSRRLAFSPPLNNWWGVGNQKWVALKEDGLAAGYYTDEVPQLMTDTQRGAYEWLLSVREVNAWKARLGPRLIELRLDDLVNGPRRTLESVSTRLGLTPSTGEWLEQAILKIRPVMNDYDTELFLPGQMLTDFNEFQESYGFKGRAAASSQRTGVAVQVRSDAATTR